MADPISGAIAGAVANTAIDQVIDYINNSEDPEAAWKRSGLEIAIQTEAAYRQELDSGRLYDKNLIQRRMNDFGEMAQQLAIRGEIRDFDSDFIELLEEFAYSCGDFADAPGGLGSHLGETWEEEVEPHVERIKEYVDIES